ncbi:MAG: DUF3365 domain-containing protein [Bacteroidia bacterium]|nr:DUF3365 domain-containing protein [Bacteroidia bacterium]
MQKWWSAMVLSLLIGCQGNSTSGKEDSPPQSNFSTPEMQAELWRRAADSLTLARQQVILQSLLKAADREGWGGAVRYCHAAAETLTFYRGEKISFQRVALRNRNPRNALADSLDRAAYDRFLQTRSKESMILMTGSSTYRYYRPIYIPMEQCLKCHGKKEQLDAQALTEIRKRYPKDQAIDFSIGDLRGMWKAEIHP